MMSLLTLADSCTWVLSFIFKFRRRWGQHILRFWGSQVIGFSTLPLRLVLQVVTTNGSQKRNAKVKKTVPATQAKPKAEQQKFLWQKAYQEQVRMRKDANKFNERRSDLRRSQGQMVSEAEVRRPEWNVLCRVELELTHHQRVYGRCRYKLMVIMARLRAHADMSPPSSNQYHGGNTPATHTQFSRRCDRRCTPTMFNPCTNSWTRILPFTRSRGTLISRSASPKRSWSNGSVRELFAT